MKFNLGNVFIEKGNNIVLKRKNKCYATYSIDGFEDLNEIRKWLCESPLMLEAEEDLDDPSTNYIYLNNVYLGQVYIDEDGVIPKNCDLYDSADENITAFANAQLFHFACANLANQLKKPFYLEDYFELSPVGKNKIVIPFDEAYNAEMVMRGLEKPNNKTLLIQHSDVKTDKVKESSKINTVTTTVNEKTDLIVDAIKEKTEEVTGSVKKHPIKSLFIFILAIAIVAHILKQDNRKEKNVIDKLKALFNDLQDKAEEWKEQALNGETFRLFNEMIGKTKEKEEREDM